MTDSHAPSLRGQTESPARVPTGGENIPGIPPDHCPERALLSCLLHLDADHARPVVARIGVSDLGSPVLVELLAAITALATVGVAPEPAAVLSLLRRDGRANGERLGAVALLLADLSAAAAVPASAGWYAARVLEEATRRRAREAGERIAQAAERVPVADLPDLVSREAGAVLVLAGRAAAAVRT